MGPDSDNMKQVLESVDDLAKALAVLVDQVKRRIITVGDALNVVDTMITRFQLEQNKMPEPKARLLDPVIGFCQTARSVLAKQAS